MEGAIFQRQGYRDISGARLEITHAPGQLQILPRCSKEECREGGQQDSG